MRSLDPQAERAAALITALEKVLSWKPDVDEVLGDLLYLRAPAGEAEASAGDKASALRARNPRNPSYRITAPLIALRRGSPAAAANLIPDADIPWRFPFMFYKLPGRFFISSQAHAMSRRANSRGVTAFARRRCGCS